MSFDDKTFGTLFPTRTGTAIGTASERKMLDATGGSEGFRKRFQNNPDGSVSRLDTKNGMPQFSRTSVSGSSAPTDYMSSGAYYIQSPFFDPAITYKSEKVTLVEAEALVPSYNRNPPADGELSKIYTAESQMLGNSESSESAMYAKRPSEFSGLMRAMIQGQYGSGNTSLRAGPLPVKVEGDPTDHRVVLNSEYSHTTGALKFGTKYFIASVKVSGTKLTVTGYPLTIPEKYTKLMAAAGDGDNFKAVETLALSRGVAVYSAAIALGVFTVPIGFPISYGWNFSLTTNKADVVLRADNGYDYDRHLWSHLSLSFSYGGSLSCSYELAEQVDGWMSSMIGPIWYPGDHATDWLNNYIPPTYPSGAQDMPVYAYYVEDALNVVRWSYSAQVIPFGSVEWDDALATAEFSNSLYGQGSASWQVTGDFGDVVTHGFYIAGKSTPLTSASDKRTRQESVTAVYKTPPPTPPAPVRSYTDRWELNFPAYSSACGVVYSSINPYIYPPKEGGYTAVPDPHYGYHIAYAVQTLSALSMTKATYMSAEQHVSALVIPKSDCSAVYIGTRRYSSQQNSGFDNAAGMYGQWDEWHYTVSDDDPPMLKLAGLWNPVVYGQVTTGNSGGYGGAVTNTWNESPIVITIDTRLYGSVEKTVGTDDANFFHPGPETTSIPLVSTISSALYGDMRYAVKQLFPSQREASSLYPDDITLFIGAS